MKIRRNKVLTEDDFRKLERDSESELFVTEETLQKTYGQSRGTLVEFVKKILGLYDFPDPLERISEAFKSFMVEKNYLNAQCR